MENYVPGKVLGKGSFGVAVLATSKLDNKNYVIKEVELARMPKVERDAAEQEARLLLELQHPNIVRCKECFMHGTKLCIVMDWCSEGDLHSILQNRKGQQLSEDTLLDWFVQICLGLKHVHDRKILHRDIKMQNIFVSSGGLLKLGDFGVSKVLSGTYALASTAVGTPYYLSPEICQNRKYNQKSDIWSLGCVLYELVTLRHAFEAPNMRALIQKIIKGTFTPLPTSRSPELRQLVSMLLTLDARKRPSINEVLALPYVRARITRFLTQTLQKHEFSHTVIHGRPEPGQLLVALQAKGHLLPPLVSAAEAGVDKLSAVAGAAAAGAGEQAGAAADGRIRLSAPAAMGPPGKLSAAPPAVTKLSGPGVRQPGLAAAPVKQLIRPPLPVGWSPPAATPTPAKSPSREQLIAARAQSPTQQAGSPAIAQQRSRVPSPLTSPRSSSPSAQGGQLQRPAGSDPSSAKAPSPRDAGIQAAGGPAVAAVASNEQQTGPMAAAHQRALLVQQERQVVKDAEEIRRAAAAQAAAEMARLRKADERQAADAAVARLAAEKRRTDMRQLEEQHRLLELQVKKRNAEAEAAARKASEQERARKRAEQAAQKRRSEEDKAKALAVEEAERRRAAAAAEREQERQRMHQQMQQQKQEYLERQKAAAANRRRAEDDRYIAVAAQGDSCQLVADASPAVAVAAPQEHHSPAAPRQRQRWRSDCDSNTRDKPAWAVLQPEPEPVATERPGAVAQPAGGRLAAAAAAELSAEQRRQVWEENHAAAKHNKQQLQAAQAGGLAVFLGVQDTEDSPAAASSASATIADQPEAPQCIQQPWQQHEPLRQQAKSTDKQQQYQQFIRHSPGAHDMSDDNSNIVGLSPLEIRKRRLEAEQAARVEQLKAFQRQHWLEIKQATANNRQQVLSELGVSKQQSCQQSQQEETADSVTAGASKPAAQQEHSLQPSGHNSQQQPASPKNEICKSSVEGDLRVSEGEGTEEFAAMLSDMQGLVDGQGQAEQQEVSAEVEQHSDTQEMVSTGRFLLDGKEVVLPVSESDSQASKVEALRMLLEDAIGTQNFLKVYHELESLTPEADKELVMRSFLQFLAADQLAYVQLINQLIVAEEIMHLQHAG